MNGNRPMRKTVNKDIFREIGNTLSRFLSILIISMLGVAFLVGLKSTDPTMKRSMDSYFDAQSLMDLRVIGSLGLTEDDVAAFSALSAVKQAEGAYTVDAYLDIDGEELVAKLYSLPSGLNLPLVLEGRLPENAGECVVVGGKLNHAELEPGNSVYLRTSEDADFIEDGDYVIVGVVQSPLYVSFERGSSTLGSGRVNCAVMLHPDAFIPEYYTDIVLKLGATAGLSRFSDEYDELVKSARKELESFAEGRTELRFEQLTADARRELDEGWADYYEAGDEAETGLSEARRELDGARRELDAGWAELSEREAELETLINEGAEKLESGWAELYSARSELNASRAEYEAGKAQFDARFTEAVAGIASGRAELNAALEAIKTSEANLAALKQQLDALDENSPGYAQMLAAYSSGMEEYSAAKAGLDALEAGIVSAELELAAGREALARAEEELSAAALRIEETQRLLYASQAELDENEAAARAALDDARAELYEGEEEYYAAFEEYEASEEEALSKLSEAKEELLSGEDALSNLSDGRSYVLSLSANPGFSSFGEDSDRIGALANVFPIIFFIVAALVCLTTMTRMVDEQRAQIGALKALGYGRWGVAKKYIVYALLASLFGSAAGIAVGCLTIPRVIFTAYSILYNMPGMTLWVEPSLCVWSTIAAVFSTTVAAFAAVFAALRSSPAELMRPRAPKPGKRVFLEKITFIWSRLSFSKKVSARNLFRYKKRFIMTVAGIGGCTALLITGFGLQDSIFGIVDIQFEHVTHYDLMAVMYPDTETDKLHEAFSEMEDDPLVDGCLIAHNKSADLSGGRRSASASILAIENGAAMSDYIALRDRKSGSPVEMPSRGAVITEKLSEMLDIGVGDMLLLDETGPAVEVAAVVENYVQHYVFLTFEYYEEVYETACEPNVFLLRVADGSPEAEELVSEKLIALGCVASVTNMSAMADSVVDSLNAINYAVLVIIVAAAALAFVVLYNLTNISITERMRELSTLKVLGFYDREVTRYIYRENLVLTVLGALLGILLGYFMHGWLVTTVEVDMVMFVRKADASSYVTAVIMTAAFSLLVNVAAHFRLKKIDMAESMKAVE